MLSKSMHLKARHEILAMKRFVTSPQLSTARHFAFSLAACAAFSNSPFCSAHTLAWPASAHPLAHSDSIACNKFYVLAVARRLSSCVCCCAHGPLDAAGLLGQACMARTPGLLPLAAACLLCSIAACCMHVVRAATDDFDDEFEGFHVGTEQAHAQAAPAAPAPSKRPKVDPGKVKGFRFNRPTTWALEALVVFAAAAYIVSFWLGKRFNRRIALSFTGLTCKEGGALQRNFSLVGPGTGHKQKQILLRQAPNNYLIWASGRRCAPMCLACMSVMPCACPFRSCCLQ